MRCLHCVPHSPPPESPQQVDFPARGCLVQVVTDFRGCLGFSSHRMSKLLRISAVAWDFPARGCLVQVVTDFSSCLGFSSQMMSRSSCYRFQQLLGIFQPEVVSCKLLQISAVACISGCKRQQTRQKKQRAENCFATLHKRSCSEPFIHQSESKVYHKTLLVSK